MTKFVPRPKLSKKARKELDAQKRTTWAFSPVTKKVQSKKIYNRKKAAHVWKDDSSMSGFCCTGDGAAANAICMCAFKAPPHNSAARLAMSFPPSASCKFLDLPPVNLRNLHLHLTKNPFASRLPHLCGVTLISGVLFWLCGLMLKRIISMKNLGRPSPKGNNVKLFWKSFWRCSKNTVIAS